MVGKIILAIMLAILLFAGVAFPGLIIAILTLTVEIKEDKKDEEDTNTD